MTRSSSGNKVTGYEAVHIDWDSDYWGGLERYNENASAFETTLLDGSAGHGNWYYAIGTATVYNRGIPFANASKESTADVVELWVRIDDATTLSASLGTNTGATINGLAEETDYIFYMSATNVAGTNYSKAIDVTTLADQAKIRIKKSLPAGYERLNYIEATGTQYIDTGITMKTSTTIDCRFEVIDRVNDYLFGQEQNGGTMMYSGLYNSGVYEYGWDAYSFPAADFIYMTQRIDGNTLITDINNSSFSMPINTTLPSYTTKIFQCNSDRYYDGTARVFFFVIKENGNPVIELYPCRRTSDSAIGMYDIVGNKFYPNLGTGTFGYGAVTDWIKGKTYYKKDGEWVKVKKIYRKVDGVWKIGSNYDN
jgi:hypothetical protein